MGAGQDTLAPGTTIGSYWIERLLGRGGMGAVFLAYDKRLRRKVALKVLDERIGGADAAAHLLREARSAAALTHPHICAIHEVAEIDGTAFIAMEYVSGASLRERLDGSPLTLTETLRYGMQAADALGYAHARDVVHRDFKAANAILDDDGRLIVIDFGIAQRTDALMAHATAVSPSAAVDSAAGTPYAMAPEQVRGRAVDARTDVWALGVLLHEMACGAAPFRAETTADLFAAILTAPPAPLPDRVPAALRAVIARCLEKDPERRYANASQVKEALAAIESAGAGRAIAGPASLRYRYWVAGAAALVALAVIVDVGGVRSRLGGAPAGGLVRLAVLPFENLTGDSEQDYFSDGLTDDMITQLGRLHPQRLSVIARSSTMPYKGRAAPIEDVGRDLGVDYVLEGSARREGTRVRINATLIRVSDRTQRWAESYDRELTGILAVQHEVARGIAGALALALLPAEEARLATAQPVNASAYEAQLKGQFHADKLTAEDLDLAQRYFELALAEDPDYAPAYAGLAFVWAGRNQMGYVPPREAMPLAKAAATEAVRLDGQLPLAHYALALVAFAEWNWTSAEDSLRRAIEINPNDPRAPAAYSYLLAALKRGAEAVEHADRARRLDPLSPFNRANYGMILFFNRRYEEAIAEFQGALELFAELPIAHCGLWHTFAITDRFDRALPAATGCIGHYSPAIGEALQRGQISAGGYAATMRAVGDALGAGIEGVYIAPIDVASAYVHASETELALEWLERSVEARDPNAFAMSADPLIATKLGSDPRLRELIGRLQLPL